MARRNGQRSVVAAQKFYQKVEERGGTSEIYVRDKEKVRVWCARNHEFMIIPNAVKDGKWCRKCVKYIYPKYLEEVQNIIDNRKGQLISEMKSYWNTITIICVSGHQFDIRPSHIRKGYWCPTCCGVNLSQISRDPF